MQSEIDQATRSLAALEIALARVQGRAEALEEQIRAAEDLLAEQQRAADVHEKALAILHALEERWRGAFEEGLAAYVSHGLTAVFGRPLSVEVQTEIKRGVANTRFILADGEVISDDIINADGGSLVEVADFLLRVLLTTSAYPPVRRLLLLDEPYSHVSAEYRPALCDLLRELARLLGFQMIVVSHEEEIADAADRAYLIEKPKDVAVVRPLKTARERVEEAEDD